MYSCIINPCSLTIKIYSQAISYVIEINDYCINTYQLYQEYSFNCNSRFSRNEISTKLIKVTVNNDKKKTIEWNKFYAFDVLFICCANATLFPLPNHCNTLRLMIFFRYIYYYYLFTFLVIFSLRLEDQRTGSYRKPYKWIVFVCCLSHV